MLKHRIEVDRNLIALCFEIKCQNLFEKLKASQTKKNKQIDGAIFYSLYVLFRVTHAFDNLLHFPMCFSCPEVHVFFAVYSGSEREGIEIIFSYYSATSDDFLLQSVFGFFMLPKQLFKSK